MNFLDRVNPGKTASYIDPKDNLMVFRDRTLQLILDGGLLIGLFAFISGMISSISGQIWSLVIINTVALAALGFVTFSRDLKLAIRAGTLIAIIYALGVSDLVLSGLNGDGRVYLIILPLLVAIFIGINAGIASSVFTTLTLAIVGWLMVSQVIPLPVPTNLANSADPVYWITGVVMFAILLLASTMSIFEIIRGLEKATVTIKELAISLTNQKDNFEERVIQQTADLSNRITEVEQVNYLARDISSIADIGDLIEKAVNTIQDKYQYENVAIFILDERREFAINKASAGKQRLVQTMRVHVGDPDVIGQAVGEAQTRIITNLGEFSGDQTDAVSGGSLSEMAVPLKFEDEVFGALHVQNKSAGGFSPEEIQLLQILSDHISIALKKSQQISKLEAALKEVEDRYKDFTQQTWRSHMVDTRKIHSYRYHESEIENNTLESMEARHAYMEGEVWVTSLHEHPESEKPVSVVAVPIKLRQQVLGVMEIRLATPTVPQDMLNLIETTISRLALALENARLMEAIQIRAEREHMVSDITSKVRASTDIDGILRTAAMELGRSLGVSEVMVQLRSADQSESK